jgi:hypothetical protein
MLDDATFRRLQDQLNEAVGKPRRGAMEGLLRRMARMMDRLRRRS